MTRIKGREFTIPRLLGDAYMAEAERYIGGALAIFRLAPLGYHRFHSPVESRAGRMTYIFGEYYTVKATVEGDYVKKGQEFGYFAFGTSALFMSASPNLIYSRRWFYDCRFF